MTGIGGRRQSRRRPDAAEGLTQERLALIRHTLSFGVTALSKSFLHTAAVDLLREIDRRGEGRPVVAVDIETIVRLRGEGKTLNAIAGDMNVSRETIRRRLKERAR